MEEGVWKEMWLFWEALHVQFKVDVWGLPSELVSHYHS